MSTRSIAFPLVLREELERVAVSVVVWLEDEPVGLFVHRRLRLLVEHLYVALAAVIASELPPNLLLGALLAIVFCDPVPKLVPLVGTDGIIVPVVVVGVLGRANVLDEEAKPLPWSV